MPLSISDDIADQVIGHTIDLMRFDASLRQSIIGKLERLSEELIQKIASMDPTAAKSNPVKLARMQQLLQDAQKTIATAYEKGEKTLSEGLSGVARVEGAFAVKSINTAVKADLMSATLAPATLRALDSKTTSLGAPALEFWQRQGKALSQRFADQMRMGVMSGEALGDLIARVRGRPTGQFLQVRDEAGRIQPLPQYAGGIIQVSEREAAALVRTSVQSIANAARYATYQANKDVIKGVQVLSTLDGRTSPICRARSGMAWDWEGKPIPGTKATYDFPGPPPWHFNCRSTLIPVLKSWAELIEPEGPGRKRMQALEDALPKSTQSSMDGQVAGDLNYEGWLKGKGEDFQKRVLGPGRWKLWKEGKIDLSQMVDQSGNPLTLVELEELVGLKKAAGTLATLPEVLPQNWQDILGESDSKYTFEVDAKELLAKLTEQPQQFGEMELALSSTLEKVKSGQRITTLPWVTVGTDLKTSEVTQLRIRHDSFPVLFAAKHNMKITVAANSKIQRRLIQQYLGIPIPTDKLDVPEIQFFGGPKTLEASFSKRVKESINDTLEYLDSTFPRFRQAFNDSLEYIGVELDKVSSDEAYGSFSRADRRVFMRPRRHGEKDTLDVTPWKMWKGGEDRARVDLWTAWSTSGGEFRGTLRHEIGHAVHAALFRSYESPEWLKLWEKYKATTKNLITLYSGRNHKEFFAEAFGTYVHPEYGKTAYRLPQEVEDFMRALLGDRR